MLEQPIFDFARPHFVARSDDQVLFAIDDEEPALRVTEADIARVQEAARVNRFLALRLFAPVTRHDLRTHTPRHAAILSCVLTCELRARACGPAMMISPISPCGTSFRLSSTTLDCRAQDGVDDKVVQRQDWVAH